MARRRKAVAVVPVEAGGALSDDEQVLAERIAANAAEHQEAEACLVDLEAEKQAALRDGTAGRERARSLIPAILTQREVLALLDEEAALIAQDALEVRARREAEALREVGRQVDLLVEGLANAAAAVDARLGGLRDDLAGFDAARSALFEATADIRPRPASVEYLGRWLWPETLAEVIGLLLFEVRGCVTLAFPLGQSGQRFAGPVSNPEHIAASIRRDLRRPEVLARRFEGAPALAEIVRQLLEGGESNAKA